MCLGPNYLVKLSNARTQKICRIISKSMIMKNKLYSILNFYIRLDLVLIFMTILESLVLSILSSMEHGLELTKYLENGSSKKILSILQELTHFQMGLVGIRSRGISIEFSRETMIRWYKWWKELRHLRTLQ